MKQLPPPNPDDPDDSSLPAVPTSIDIEELENILKQVIGQAAQASRALSTRRRYKTDWRKFEEFCRMTMRCPLPADVPTVELFLAWYGLSRKTGTLRSARAAIRVHHEEAGHLDPTTQPEITTFFAGHARLTGQPPVQKLALSIEQIREICSLLDAEGGWAACRDKAAFLLAYGGALRASEVVNAQIQHVLFKHRGLTLLIPKSKTDQEGQGQDVSVVRTTNLETCPVTAMEDWLSILKSLNWKATDPLFPRVRTCGDAALQQCRVEQLRLSTQGYRAMLKRRCSAIGIDPASIGGHSLRAGHATQAAECGVDVVEIAKQGRWKDLRKVMVYVRSGQRFAYNSSGKLGL